MSSGKLEEVTIRAACAEDASEIAAILANAFPSLYNAAFGRLSEEKTAHLLAALYRAEILSLEATRVCERAGRVVGVLILHIGKPIGRGTVGAYASVLVSELGWRRAPVAFFGGLSTNAFLNRRIPRADNLVYIEALAVTAQERSKGIGTLLLAEAERWAREHGRRRLALHVLVSNTGARRLYERTGFVPWHSEERGAGGRFLSSAWGAILLERELKKDSGSDRR